MGSLEEKGEQLEALFLSIVEERKSSAPPPASARPKTPGKKGKEPRVAVADLSELDLETALTNGEGYALLIRARRALRNSAVEATELRQALADMEQAAAEHSEKLAAATSALAAETLRAEDLAGSLGDCERARKLLAEELSACKGEVDALRGGAKPYEVLAAAENLAKSKDKEIRALREDVRGLRAQIRHKDKAIADITREKKGKAGDEGAAAAVVRLRSELRIAQRRLEDLSTESKVMERHFRLRSQAMERASREAERKAGDGDARNAIEDLRNQVRLRDRAIRDLEEEKRTIMRVSERQTKALAETVGTGNATADAFGGSSWSEERKVLLSEVRTEKEKRLALEKEVRADNARVAKLAARVDHMAEIARRQQQRRGGASHSHNHHQSVTSSPSGHDDSAVSARMSGDGDEETVPATLYDQLMKETQSLRRSLALKETTLEERDAVIESLERKSGILDKARGVESRKGRQEAAQMATAIAELKLRIVEQTEQFKERELQLRMLNLRLKNQLKAANSYIQEYVGADVGGFGDDMVAAH